MQIGSWNFSPPLFTSEKDPYSHPALGPFWIISGYFGLVSPILSTSTVATWGRFFFQKFGWFATEGCQPSKPFPLINHSPPVTADLVLDLSILGSQNEWLRVVSPQFSGCFNYAKTPFFMVTLSRRAWWDKNWPHSIHSGLAGITLAFALELTSAIDLPWLQRKAQMRMVQDLQRRRVGRPIHYSRCNSWTHPHFQIRNGQR